eukprot:4200735-Alexandrium_andersonii.AAC.1
MSSGRLHATPPNRRRPPPSSPSLSAGALLPLKSGPHAGHVRSPRPSICLRCPPPMAGAGHSWPP